jgi:hypothetical protein
VKQAQAHHFIPAAHLARFSASPPNVEPRNRVLHLYDKRSGGFRQGKVGKVGFENDLYTFRIPDLKGVEPELEQLAKAVFDPANKDAELETAKIDIETNGLAAIQAIDGWGVGQREVSEDERAPLLAYFGLLLAQHPTMMSARATALRNRFWEAASFRSSPPTPIRTVFDEAMRGAGAFAVVFDGFATALELNYLAWKVIRWRDGPRLILGDVGVAAWYPGGLWGVGDPWTPDATFVLPISPTSVVVLGGFAPGLCVVEDRSGVDAEEEICVMNVGSWARSRAEVYAADRGDLERTISLLGPIDPRADHSAQLRVRTSVLPGFEVDAKGDLKINQPSEPDGDQVQERFESRFKSIDPNPH